MREKGQALFLFIQEYQPFGDTGGSFLFFSSLSVRKAAGIFVRGWICCPEGFPWSRVDVFREVFHGKEGGILCWSEGD